MFDGIDPGALLSRQHTLPSGVRLRLRMLSPRSDAEGVRALAARTGSGLADVEVARLLRYDPRRRAVICATAWSGEAEEIVAIGAIEVGPCAKAETLLSDEAGFPGSGALVGAALAARARQLARRAA